MRGKIGVTCLLNVAFLPRSCLSLVWADSPRPKPDRSDDVTICLPLLRSSSTLPAFLYSARSKSEKPM